MLWWPGRPAVCRIAVDRTAVDRTAVDRIAVGRTAAGRTAVGPLLDLQPTQEHVIIETIRITEPYRQITSDRNHACLSKMN